MKPKVRSKRGKGQVFWHRFAPEEKKRHSRHSRVIAVLIFKRHSARFVEAKFLGRKRQTWRAANPV
jgi:hypothetical protein